MRLRDRVALVTGASRGIGRAAAVGFAREGAAVVVNYLENRSAAEAVVAEIEEHGGRASAVQGDVSRPGDVRRMFRALRRFADDRLDILFANAGIYPDTPLDTLTVAAWDRVIAVNLRGVFLCTKEALPLLRQSAAGRILLMSSNTAFLGTPNRLPYASAKAGIIGFTHALAKEVGGDRITVNCLTPSLIPTGSNPQVVRRQEQVAKLQAIPEPMRPEDLVETLLFLASDGGRLLTGQTINIDGGLLLR